MQFLGNRMTFEIKDLAGLSQPATKLIEVVSAAIGTLHRPRAIQAEAVAKAFELRTIGEAQAEVEETKKRVALQGALNRIEHIAAQNPELAARATQRLLLREIEGQENIESIVNNAMLALPPAASDQPVSPDWRRRFFIEAENVCDADMQFLWGKVLAGEVSSPGSFSIRTLDALRYISQAEAELFRKACAIAMQDGWIAVSGHDLNSALAPFGIAYGDILALRDLGLMIDGDHIHKDFRSSQPVPDPEKHRVVLVNNRKLIELSGPGLLGLRMSALIFSKVGRELQQLIDPSPTDDYFRALGLHLRSLAVTAKLGKVVSTEGSQSVIAFEEEMANLTPSAP
jgi:hypothetical protein